MKNFKHEFREWLIVAAQGSIFIVMFIVFIFAAMSAGCGGQETVRPVADTEEVSDEEEDLDEVVDETADEVDFEGVDAEDVDSDEVTDEEDSDSEESDNATDDDADSDEVPDEVVEEGWTQVITASSRSPVQAVSCGIYKTQLYCWGTNEAGNFGNGTLVSSNKPVVAGGSLFWSKIVLNVNRTFGIDTEGFLYAWGGNWFHDINFSDQPEILEPFKMSHIKFIDLSIITDQLCGLTSNGQEWCQDSVTKEMVLKREGVSGYWPDVTPGLSFISSNNRVGLLEGGRIIAYAKYAYKDWPNPLRNIQGTSLLTQIDGRLADEATGEGSYCAVDLNKELWCWTPFETTGSIKHTGDYTFWYNNILSGVVNFSKALNHTCSVTTAGKLYCWGSNKEGQLGLGYASDTAVTEPQEIVIY